MKYPLVSVIIVTLNNKIWLKKSLDALYAQEYKTIEVFVVDNGSIDGTDIVINKKYPKVIYIPTGQNLGFGPAANFALKKANGKYALIYNDDAICDKRFISLLVRQMEKDPAIGAVQGTLLFADKKNILESAGAFLTPTGILIKEFGIPFNEKSAKQRKVFNANLPLMRMSVLQKVGFFDDDYFLYFEEADLCWRIWLAGFNICYYPNAKIYHARGVTTKRLQAPIIVESTFKNRINSLLKNLELKSIIRILPIHLAICFGGIIAYLLKGKPQGALAILKAIVWNIHSIKNTIQKRKKIQRFRSVTDRQLFPIIVKPMSFSYLKNMAFDYLKQW